MSPYFLLWSLSLLFGVKSEEMLHKDRKLGRHINHAIKRPQRVLSISDKDMKTEPLLQSSEWTTPSEIGGELPVDVTTEITFPSVSEDTADNVTLLTSSRVVQNLSLEIRNEETSTAETLVTNTTGPSLPEYNCLQRGSCLSPVTAAYRNCFCDNLCHKFDDCCYDAPSHPADVNVDTARTSRCQRLGDAWFHVVVTCPSEAEPKVKRGCEVDSHTADDIIIDIPVTDVSSGLTFKNLYCGECNGLNLSLLGSQVVLWDQDFMCSWPPEGSQLSDVQLLSVTAELFANATLGLYRKYCTGRVRPPQTAVSPRQCVNSVTKCHGNWPPEDEPASKCLKGSTNYTYEWSTGGVIYKNQFCAICNFLNVSDVNCVIQESDVGYNGDTDKLRAPPSFSMRLLLDMNQGELSHYIRGSDGKLHRSDVTFPKCHHGAVLDFLAGGKCRQVVCKDGSIIHGDDQCPNLSDEGSGGEITGVPPCAMIHLNKSEITTDAQGGLHAANRTHPKDTLFWLSNDTAAMCINITQRPRNAATFRPKSYVVEAYISTIGYALSLVAMAAMLVVYIFLSQLRNLPGKCLLCLVASLFTAQLLFLLLNVPKASTWLCLVVSVLCHYSYLAAFFWKNVLAYDTWRTFSLKALRPPRRPSRTKRFLAYSAYAWLGPALLVVFALLVDYDVIPGSDERPKYAEFYCWINNMSGLLWFFAGPVAILLGANFFFFALTVHSICRGGKNGVPPEAGVHRMSKKTHLVLYVKLSVMMGLTWAFGLLANAASDSLVLWYLFIVFGSLQGLFICVGFVCNKKVYRLILATRMTVKPSGKQQQLQAAERKAMSSKAPVDLIREVAGQTRNGQQKNGAAE